MSVFSGIASTIQSAVKHAVDVTKSFTNQATNNVGGVLKDIGNLSGDPVLRQLGIELQGVQNRSQTVKDIEKNAPIAAALYFGGEYLYNEFGAAGGAGGSGAAGAGATAPAGAGGAGAAGAAAAGAAGATGPASSAAAGAAGATGAGLTATGVQTQGALSEIIAVIAKVEAAIHDFVSPITNTINEINNGIIQPIVGPINALVQESQAIHQFVANDLHSGIMGILKIPGDLASSLNTITAAFNTALLQATAAQTQIFQAGLTEAGPDFGLSGSTLVAGGIAAALPGEAGAWTAPQRDQITDTVEWQSVLASAEKTLADLMTSSHWYDRLWATCFSVFAQWPIIAAQYSPYAEAAEEAQRRVVQATILGADSVLAAFKRGLLDPSTAANELKGGGLNDSRIKVLMDLQRTLPGLSDAINWEQRGQLKEGEFQSLMAVLGYADEDIQRFQAAAVTLPDSGQAVDWWRRGILTEAALDGLLTAQGYDPQIILAIKAGSNLLPQLADWMRAYDRDLAISENPGTNVNADDPPPAYMQEAARLGVSNADASLLWANHLQLLPPGLAVTSLFRGYINSDQYNAFMRAAGFTKDMAAFYLDANRPQIPFRSLTTLVKLGLITEADAQEQLRALGFPDQQILWLLQLSQATTKTTGATTAATIHKDVQQTTLELYNAGMLTRAQADTALAGAGLTADAVTALLNLADVKNTAAAHKLEAETVEAQVASGVMTVEEGMAALDQFGLSTQQKSIAVTKLNTAARRRVKLPAEGTLLNMYRRTILTAAQAHDTLVLLGYSDVWATRLIDLEAAEHGISK